MSARRNSPRIDQLGTQGAMLARAAMARMPAPPKQAEMGGMETSAATALLTSVQRERQKKAEKKTAKEDAFNDQLRGWQMPRFERNFMFALEEIGRRWKFDFAFLQYKVAVEIEGIVVQRVHIATLDASGRVVKATPELIVRGRHASVDGFNEDCLKYASAAMLGWTVIRFTPKQVQDKVAIEYTQRVLHAKGWTR